MHTDEYEIALARELKVCESAIRKATRFLASMNTKYDLETSSFIEQYNSGALGKSSDFNAWADSYKALQEWETRRKQYEELLRTMKI
jgi:DNA polymerase III delta prime subunit